MEYKKTITEIVLMSTVISLPLASLSNSCFRCEEAIKTPDFSTPEYRISFNSGGLIVVGINSTTTTTATSMVLELSTEKILNRASEIINSIERTS